MSEANEGCIQRIVVRWCGRCKHANRAFYVPYHGLCVHCCHTDESISGEPGWGTLRTYKETRCDCSSWEQRQMHNPTGQGMTHETGKEASRGR